MKYAAVARPPVVGGTVKSVDDSSAALKIAGVERVEPIPGAAARRRVQAARRRRRWSPRTPGRRCRAATRSRSNGRPARTAPTIRPSMRRSCAPASPIPARRCATRATPMPHSPARQRCSRASTTSSMWRTRQWSRRSRSPMSPPASARSGRCLQSPYGAAASSPTSSAWSAANVTVHVDAARRRLRAQIEVRLRHRGGLSVARGRRAGARAVDPRGRHPPLLPPHHLGGEDRHRARCRRTRWWPGGTAARSRPSCRPSRPTKASSTRSRSAWDWRTCPSTSPMSGPSSARRWRTRASAGTAPCRTSRAPSPCSRSSAELAAELGRDQKDFLLEMIGAPRKLDWQTIRHDAGFLEPRRADATSSRSTPAACAA